ncbi:uncharacterized protein [Miscanthus floridulus]|uniref:uncharacterized protein n=1 Tax=Miscanthus floridulus TaxID=154761 RepID=UPI003459782A
MGGHVVSAFVLSSGVLFLSCIFPVNGLSKVRGVNLGGWLVIEGWIKPSLFDGIPNGDMLDGTQVQIRSVVLNKYVSAANGGGSNVTVDRDVASTWETFRLWRVSDNEFQLRCLGGQFLTSNSEDGLILATAKHPLSTETFFIERNAGRVHIRLLNGGYVQATNDHLLISTYQFQPGWTYAPAATMVSPMPVGHHSRSDGWGRYREMGHL